MIVSIDRIAVLRVLSWFNRRLALGWYECID